MMYGRHIDLSGAKLGAFGRASAPIMKFDIAQCESSRVWSMDLCACLLPILKLALVLIATA